MKRRAQNKLRVNSMCNAFQYDIGRNGAAISRNSLAERMTLLLFNQRAHMFDGPTCGLAEGESTH